MIVFDGNMHVTAITDCDVQEDEFVYLQKNRFPVFFLLFYFTFPGHLRQFILIENSFSFSQKKCFPFDERQHACYDKSKQYRILFFNGKRSLFMGTDQTSLDMTYLRLLSEQ